MQQNRPEPPQKKKSNAQRQAFRYTIPDEIADSLFKTYKGFDAIFSFEFDLTLQ